MKEFLGSCIAPYIAGVAVITLFLPVMVEGIDLQQALAVVAFWPIVVPLWLLKGLWRLFKGS